MSICWGEGKYRSQALYDEYNTMQVKLKLNCKTDKDIIKWINRLRNDPNASIQGTIKALIRERIASEENDFAKKG